MTVRRGTVYLVGAGPGDPGLITVRGRELLQRADVVVHDRLVEEALLLEASPSARLVDVGKTPYETAISQAEINETLVRHARDGQVVVRLKGGDPYVFGRGWEEREACQRAGVPCETVPGVSSAIAGPASAGIPVTLRGVSSSLVIAAAPVLDDQKLGALSHADTIVLLMGVRELAQITRRLIEHGKSASTPAAVIERATMPGERVIHSELGRIAVAASDAGIEAPALLVVGPTAALARANSGPLHGRRIVVTRPRQAAHQLTSTFRLLGADVISAPLIRIDVTPPEPVEIMDRLGEFDWIVFSSRHGVRAFRRAVERSGRDLRAFGAARIAAVGPTTARELATWGLRADVVPTPARADALVKRLLQVRPVPERILFPCGTLAFTTIPRMLMREGIPVDRLTVYSTSQCVPDARIRREIERGVDAVLLASPSAVTALGSSGISLGTAQVVCIGETTARAARVFGWPDVHVAAVHSDEGLVDTTLRALGALVTS